MAIHWKDIVAEKRARQQAAIPKQWLIATPPPTVLDVTKIPEECGLLTSKELEITNTDDIAIILAKLASAEWSAVEVTTAFCKRAIIAHQLVNCLTEIMVERALARAAELDAHLKATGKVVGPLHGLPISLKDQLRIKGMETTMGYVSWIGKYAEKDSVLVQILHDAGAVLYVQTNVPQTLMWGETYNKIFGRTVNPRNRNLTPGGSSGGEGALVGMRGSPLGVGTDIGGSVRIPSAFNGLYGLRSSYGRVPYSGAANSLEGQESILSVLGPLSHTLNGLKLFLQAVLEGKPWLKDPLVRRAPWREDMYQLVEHNGGKELCFGIMWTDGKTTPHPPIVRALQMTKAALLAAGHKVIDWKPTCPSHREICKTAFDIWGAGARQDFAAVTASTGEPIIGSMAIEDEDVEVANSFLPDVPEVSAYGLWQLHKKKLQQRQDYLDAWNDTVNSTGTGRPIDALIAPVSNCASAPHGKNRNADYTAVWNALDYSACAFPVTTVDPVLDAKKPLQEFVDDADKAQYEQYDPETWWNAPVGLQVVGRGQEEEAVLAITEIVANALQQRK